MQLLALGGVAVVDTLLEVGFNLVADNLHCAVYQAVLLREMLINDGINRRQPTVGELTTPLATCAILAHLGIDKVGRSGSLITRIRSELGFQRIAIWYDNGNGIWGLVVVNHNLVDVWRLIDNRLLHTLWTVFLAIGRD